MKIAIPGFINVNRKEITQEFLPIVMLYNIFVGAFWAFLLIITYLVIAACVGK